MTRPSCPEDGYPLESTTEFGTRKTVLRCTNPWHPHNPSPCPACDSVSLHMRAFFGSGRRAACASCGHLWEVELPAEEEGTVKPETSRSWKR